MKYGQIELRQNKIGPDYSAYVVNGRKVLDDEVAYEILKEIPGAIVGDKWPKKVILEAHNRPSKKRVECYIQSLYGIDSELVVGRLIYQCLYQKVYDALDIEPEEGVYFYLEAIKIVS